MKSIKAFGLAGCAVAALIASNQAMAASTAAGTEITNNVTVNYKVGDATQIAKTASDVFTVDRKIDLIVTELGNASTLVSPGQAGAVTTFTLTNNSNATLDFTLLAEQLTGGTAAHGGTDVFDVTGLKLFVDSNNNQTYDPLIDTATFVDELAKDSSITIFVIGDIPTTGYANDVAGVRLTATAREGGSAGGSAGAALVETIGANSAGVDTVFADGTGSGDGARDAAYGAQDDYKVNVLPADLSVTITADKTNPLTGFDVVTFTISVTNSGPANGSGIVVTAKVPSGYGYVSNDSGGAWNNTTGVWTVGNLAIGETKTFTYSAIAGSQGSRNSTAVITAAGQTDPDSNPATGFPTDDFADGIADDDEAAILTAPVLGTGTVSAASCANGTALLDWTSESWTQGGLTGSFNVAGKPITLTIVDSNGALQGTPTAVTPVNAAFYQGGLTTTENSLVVEATDAKLAGNPVTFTYELGPAGIGVESPRFKLFDIDGSPNNTRFEGITVTGSFNGSPVAPQLQGGSAISISGNTAVGSGDVPYNGASSGNGTLQVAFTGQVDKISFTWGHAPGTSSTGGAPGFALHDLQFCRPNIGMAIDKTSKVYDPQSAGLFAVPGNDVIYTVSVANVGDVPSDPNSILLIDRMPAELEFYNGDIDDGGPESNPVTFSQTGPNLTFNYSSDVAYSNASIAPTSFAACTYSPTAGYDSNVKFICFNPKGILPEGAPDPGFQLQYRARIK